MKVSKTCVTLINLVFAMATSVAAAQTAPTPSSPATSNVASLLNEAPPVSTTLDGVVLSAKAEGDRRLQPLPGSFSTTYAFVTMLMFMDFVDQHAALRTTDHRPVLHLKIGVNPKGRVYLVKAESNPKTDNRSVKLGHSGFGSIGNMSTPDAKWIVPATVEAEGPGIWRVTPDADLAPGEYGVFTPNLAGNTQVPASGDLYDFGVD